MTRPPRAKSTTDAVRPSLLTAPTALRGTLLATSLLSALLASGCLPDAAATAPARSGTGGNAGSAGSGAGGTGPCVPDASSVDDCLPQPATAQVANGEFCATNLDGDCPVALNERLRTNAKAVESCCVALLKPSIALQRSNDTKEYSGQGAVNLSCFSPGGYPVKIASGTGDTSTVTVSGIAKAFSNGCDLKGVTIEIYKVVRTGDPAADGTLGALVGAPVVTTEASEAVEDTDEGCTNDKVLNRRFSYPGVPKNTELLIKTSGPGWSPLYTYGTFIAEGDPHLDAKAKTYEKDVHALTSSDYKVIPMAATGGPINPGRGTINGEIHDCGDVRVQNAAVELSGSASRRALVYFNDDEDSPMPDPGRDGTGRTSIYAAIDVEAGFQRVTAVGLLEAEGQSQVVSLGYYDVRVFPDAATSVTLRGLQPHQVR